MMRTKMLVPLAIAATALAAAGPAAAKSPHPTRYDKKQNAAIKKVATSTSKAGRSAKAANLAAAKVAKDLGTMAGNLKSTSDGLAAIQAAVPTVLDGLTKLKDGLTTLGDAYKAVEYGVAALKVTGGTVAVGGSVTSADVPDDGNPAQAGDTAMVVVTANGAVGIDLKADIRSAEADGVAGQTVGQAGGYLYVKALNGAGAATPGTIVACGGTPSPGIMGTQAGDSIVTPTGPVTNLPLKNLPGGVDRTDQTHPDASSTSLLPAPCQFPGAAGGLYEVHYMVNFLDIPTSTSPGAKD